MKSFTLAVLVSCLAYLAGCSPMRFVIDAVPRTDALTETVVLEEEGRRTSDKVALIEFTGLIADANRPGLISPGENPVSGFVESLRRAAKDKHVKAVVIRINSPGGAVTATDLLYREVIRFKEETGKPVVVLMADVAASGGFYLACAGDHVIAFPTTVTGSIGVIIQTINFSEGLSRIGIRADAITSGPNKSMGSPFEPMSEEHRQLFQDLVDEFYNRFRDIVVARRDALSPGDLDWVTDGRVVSGARAAEIGLVDAVGDLHDAFDAARELAGVEHARLVKYHRPLQYIGSPYAQTPVQGQFNVFQLNVDAGVVDQPGFYYLWDPSIPW